MNGKWIASTWFHALADLYGEDRAGDLAPAIHKLLADRGGDLDRKPKWDRRDAWLIAYPDQIGSKEEAPLATLNAFYRSHLAGTFNGIHILPFFPSTSDEGFSVSDYLSVEPEFGDWDDILAIGEAARLMVDAVLNHASVASEHFRLWRDGEPEHRHFFRTADPDADLSATTRAREHPLLTPFATARGTEWVWTTFSPDQADLNYGDPNVLLSMLEVLLTYVDRGASMIRLDAVCFLWKQEGTSSIHLPETHRLIQFFRACLDETHPNVVLVSETNVPHHENISYLGDGKTPEADMAYRFTLPPLTLHAFTTGQARDLARWLDETDGAPQGTTYLNFLASHDGVGLRPLEGVVDDAGVEQLVAAAQRRGGRVNRRRRADGASAPYELNATWYDLIRGPTSGDDALARHVASHAVMLAIVGVPAIYLHALFASKNDIELMRETGSARSINRTRLERATLVDTLSRSGSRAARSLDAMLAMLRWRRSSRAFDPASDQAILDTPAGVIGILRRSANGETARVYVNVSEKSATIAPGPATETHGYRYRPTETVGGFELGPWGTMWLINR